MQLFYFKYIHKQMQVHLELNAFIQDAPQAAIQLPLTLGKIN